MPSKSPRASIVILVFLALYPATLARFVLLPIPGSTLWRGYYTLVLPARGGIVEAEARLDRAGFSTISASSALLDVADFSGVAMVPVAELSRRFVASDPRLDPYLREAPALFRTGGDRLIYVGATGGLLLTELRLSAALGGMPWRLADAAFGRQAAGLLLLLAAAVVTALGAKRRRLHLVRIAGLLPWIPLAATGLPGLVASSLLAYGGWALLLEPFTTGLDEWARNGRLEAQPLASGLAVMLAAGAAVFLLDRGRPGLAVVTGEAFAADLTLAGLIWHARLRAVKPRGRRRPQGKRAPAQRAKSPAKRRPAETPIALLLLAPLVAATFFLDRVGHGTVRPPVPTVVAGLHGWSEAAVSRLARAEAALPGGERLPSFAGYVEHQAYQKGLSFGGAYAFPAPDERITLPFFRREGRRFVESPETVVFFGARWYARILRRGDGLTPLFRAQLRPTLTVRASPRERLGLGARGWLVFPLALLLFGSALGLGEGLTPLFMYGMRSAGSRRKQQAA